MQRQNKPKKTSALIYDQWSGQKCAANDSNVFKPN